MNAEPAHSGKFEEDEVEYNTTGDSLRDQLRLVRFSPTPNLMRETLLEAACELRARPVEELNTTLRFPMPIRAQDGGQATVYFQVFSRYPGALSTFKVYLCTDPESRIVAELGDGTRVAIHEDSCGPFRMNDLLEEGAITWISAEGSSTPTDWKSVGFGVALLGLSYAIVTLIILLGS